jgi:hypothetical protein
LYGARADVHDWHAGSASFDATIRALTTARSCGLTITVRSILTRSNAGVIGELPSLLKARGVATWIVELARAEGDVFTRLVPRLALGAPRAIAAIERARALGIDARLRGFALCVLGPYAARADGEPRAYGVACDGCAARAKCPGVDRAYLDRFGERELRPM